MKKFLLPPIVLSSLLALAACSERPGHTEAAEPAKPVAVQTVPVALAEWPVTYEAIGTVRARTAAVISSKVTGYVREANFQTGDRVRQGQLLISLDARDLDAHYRQAQAALSEARNAGPEAENGVAAAKANLDLAEVTFGRMKDLMEKKSISSQEFDEATARLKAAQANYEMARSKRQQLSSKIAQAEEAVKAADIMRGYSEIAAPFAGTVTEKRVEPGNLATPGTPLLTIEREGTYRLEASVEESLIARIRTGQAVSVALDALDRKLDARVSEVVPAVDAASRAYVVKINLPPIPQLRSGLFGRAMFTLGTRKGAAVPGGAVVERGQLRSVLVVEQGVARNRLVTLGESLRDQREVLSGLEPGEKVIFPIPAGLSDGAGVEVRP